MATKPMAMSRWSGSAFVSGLAEQTEKGGLAWKADADGGYTVTVPLVLKLRRVKLFESSHSVSLHGTVGRDGEAALVGDSKGDPGIDALWAAVTQPPAQKDR